MYFNFDVLYIIINIFKFNHGLFELIHWIFDQMNLDNFIKYSGLFIIGKKNIESNVRKLFYQN